MGIVSFARGLNDTPKIVALLLVVDAFQLCHGMIIVAVAMADGGLLHARRVREVMSKDITPISRGRGFAANVATGVLVVAASKFGLPVSTNHDFVGAIFGLGAVSGRALFHDHGFADWQYFIEDRNFPNLYNTEVI